MARLARSDEFPKSSLSDHSSPPNSLPSGHFHQPGPGEHLSPVGLAHLLEALRPVSRGELGGQALYMQSPREIRELFDNISTGMLQMSFCKLNDEAQRKVCQMMLEVLEKVLSGQP
jgi:hypothetical protein